uniref:Uncharacterized protein n=1 Tax=Glossina palpalis gambiensis TaxID=67801 RepID=A0A1B0C0H1_9MUSC
MTFKNIRKQMDSSLQYTRNLLDELHDLEIRYPPQKVIKTDNKEAETVLQDLTIGKPNLSVTIKRLIEMYISNPVWDFLIVHKLIEEMKHVYELVELYCNNII